MNMIFHTGFVFYVTHLNNKDNCSYQRKSPCVMLAKYAYV